LIFPIKGWDGIFFYFLGEKSPAGVAKMPATILNPAFHYLHYNIFERGCEAILQFLAEIASHPCSNCNANGKTNNREKGNTIFSPFYMYLGFPIPFIYAI